MATRLLVAGFDTELRHQISQLTNENHSYEVVGIARDGQETIEMAMQLQPHIILIAYDLPGITGPQTCEMLSAIAPGILSVLVCETKSSDRVDMALRSGARALVAKPVDAGMFDALLNQLMDTKKRRESDDFKQWEDPTRYPKIITVTGAKGGVGKSSIAVNLAVSLAKQLPNKVAIVDLCTQFGDVATMLNIAPKHTIIDMLTHCKELEPDLVQSHMTKHSSGVHALVASITPIHFDAISVEAMENLLYVLKRMYRYVIIDVPPILHQASLRLLANSNYVMLVANLFDLTTIADTKKFNDTLISENIAREKIKIVLNRVSKSNAVNIGDIEKMLDCDIIAQIPDESRLVNAVNQGVPLVSMDGDSAFAQHLNELANTLSGTSSRIIKPNKFAAMMAGIMGGMLGTR